MRRPGHYADFVNQMGSAQMQPMSSQRLQNSGMNHFQGRADSFQADEEHQYMPSNAEGQWQWDRDGSKESNLMPSKIYKEGEGSDAPRSQYRGQRSNSRSSLEKQGGKDARSQDHNKDEMELGYEDDTLPQTFEDLEKKFLQDIMKLTKEQQKAEDTENARHRERLNEINSQYEENLLGIRARQDTQRDEFLRRESQARHQQYQRENTKSYQNRAGPSEAHVSYRSAPMAAGGTGDPHRAYTGDHFDNYGEQPEFVRGAQGPRFEPRGQYPGGRAYNTGGRYF